LSKQGWISLHREIQDNFLWEDKPFDKARAWIDILLMVNHENKKIIFGSQVIDVQRGEKITSIRKLSDRWGWSTTKTDTFLLLLQKEKMIELKKDTKKTVVKVLNYANYQDRNKVEKDTEMTPERQQSDTEVTPKNTNNNDNNANNVNKELFMPGADKSASGQAADSSPVIIDLTLNDKTKYSVTQKRVDEWKELYPAVDVEQQLRNMKGWLDSNPKRRKTKSGILKFITSWLAREQDRGGTYRGQGKSKSNMPEMSPERQKAYEEMEVDHAVDLWPELEAE
jgi:hypothetical protein